MSTRPLPSLLLVVTMLGLLLSGCTEGATGAIPTSTPGDFLPFDVFLTQVEDATFDAYAHLPGAQVQDAQAFEEMRAYIKQMYAGVQSGSSFVSEEQYVDCITIASQPSVHQLGLTAIARAPAAAVAPPEPVGSDALGDIRYSPSVLTLGQTDPFGHPISCVEGTIPMQRLTLDKLVAFKTLRQFLAKAPDGQEGAPPDSDKPTPESASHRYAVAVHIAYNNGVAPNLGGVPNRGGGSVLNLWNPTSKFAISQQWYTGKDSSGTITQTLEGGWIRYGKFGSNAVLFTYWTADNYVKTGCYNLECAGFVQTNHNWCLGCALPNYSSIGGTQWALGLQWKLDAGNWWLYLKGGGAYEPVGYLPTARYNGGPLATAASGSAYGGETSNFGSGAYPPMGSGQFATTGWQQAAYQRSLFYIPLASSDLKGQWAIHLLTSELTPACYTIHVPPPDRSGQWGPYFYFGGPGGAAC
jgi:hypothetical protein